MDCPEVFEFIERVRAENVWTFTFEKTAEIKDSLTHQLSVLLKDLLNRSKGGSLEPVRGFAGESEEAQRLARGQAGLLGVSSRRGVVGLQTPKIFDDDLTESKITELIDFHRPLMTKRLFATG